MHTLRLGKQLKIYKGLQRVFFNADVNNNVFKTTYSPRKRKKYDRDWTAEGKKSLGVDFSLMIHSLSLQSPPSTNKNCI